LITVFLAIKYYSCRALVTITQVPPTYILIIFYINNNHIMLLPIYTTNLMKPVYSILIPFYGISLAFTQKLMTIIYDAKYINNIINVMFSSKMNSTYIVK